MAARELAPGVTVWAHAADTPAVRDGTPRPFPTPANPVLRALTALVSPFVPKGAAPTPVTGSAAHGDQLPVAGGLQAIHTPGHTPGHLSLLWPRHGGVLFCADALSNFLRVSLSPLNEDHAQARQSLARLTGLEFQVACFGHGRPVTSDAAATIRSAVARVADGR